MADLIINEPTVAPERIIVRSAATATGPQVEVFDRAYNTFAPAGGFIVLSDAGIVLSNWHFVYFRALNVNSDPLIIAPQSAGGMTVQELLQLVLPRLQGPLQCDLFAAVREVQGVITHRLLLRRSELLQNATEATLAYAINAQTASLPADFKSLAERPYIAGERPLAALDKRSTDTLQDAATPKYYKVLGRTLWLYPPPDAAITVRVPYYANPPMLTAMTDVLPFLGEFDRVFVEGAVIVLRSGLSAVADKAFVALIQSQVDAVLTARDLLDEQQLADAINER